MDLGLWVILSLAVVDLILTCGNFVFTAFLFIFTLTLFTLIPIILYTWLPSSVVHMKVTIDAEAKLATIVGFSVGRNYIWWVLDSVCPMMF